MRCTLRFPNKNFIQTDECYEAFKKLKHHLAQLSQVSSSILSETLSIYLNAIDSIVTSVLVWDNSRVQKLIYYVSHVLSKLKKRYPPIKKFTFALILITRKLYSYFQGYAIHMIIDQPLKQILSRFNISRHLLRWLIELGEFDIQYVPRTTIKAQALADFISELTPLLEADNYTPLVWTLFMDGSTTLERDGVGLILKGLNKQVYEEALRIEFKISNNEAEYKILLLGLSLTQELQVQLDIGSSS